MLSKGETGPRSHSRWLGARLGPEALFSPAARPGQAPPPPTSRPVTQHRRPAREDFRLRLFRHPPARAPAKLPVPKTQGARACPSPAAMGTPGGPRVLLLTYALATLELTCLFMQFSILPVSASPGSRPPAGPRLPPRHPSVPRQGQGAGAGCCSSPSLGAPCHTGGAVGSRVPPPGPSSAPPAPAPAQLTS